MELDNFKSTSGKPLTARRIIAVRDAILQAVEKVDAKAIGSRKAGALVDAAVAYVNNSLADSKISKKQLQLDAAQRTRAVELVKAHGSGLTENGRKILANYVVTGHMRGDLTFNSKHAPYGWNNLSMGKIDSVLEFEFDLSDPDNAVLTSVHFGQTIDMTPSPPVLG